MYRRCLATALLLAPLALPGGAAAKPPMCEKGAIVQLLVADGKLTTAASSSAAAAMAELAPQISAIAERVGALRR